MTGGNNRVNTMYTMYFDITSGLHAVAMVIVALLVLGLGIGVPCAALLAAADGDEKAAIFAIIWITIEAFIVGGIK